MKPFYLETEFIEKWANVCAVQDARGHRQLERESGLGLGERWWRERGLGVVPLLPHRAWALALQYQFWTAEGNVSLRMLNLQPRAEGNSLIQGSPTWW